MPGEPPVDVHLKVPGAHNARNAAGALAALAAAGASTPDAAAALAEFTGVGRRFELRGTVAGATIVDDYAHNPAKVAAVIDAARTYAPARVVVCFQPHLYSRTAASAHAFGGALAGADEVVVTEIYAARERPVAGVTGQARRRRRVRAPARACRSPTCRSSTTRPGTCARGCGRATSCSRWARATCAGWETRCCDERARRPASRRTTPCRG